MDKLGKIREFIKKKKVEAVLISSVANITYLTGFSGFSKEERDGYLIVTSDAQYIMTHSLYAQGFKEDNRGFELLEITAKNNSKKIFEDLVFKHGIKKMGIEEYDLRVSEYKRLKQRFKKLVPFEIEELRAVKNSEEIDNIKRACEIGDEAFEFLLKKIKVGLSESELEREYKGFLLEQGAEVSFPTIVAFGSNAAIPHHKTSERILKKNEVVLMDYGVMYKNYCSDMTRTVFVGEVSEREKIVYQVVKNAQKKACEYIEERLKNKKKVVASEADKKARDFILEQGFGDFSHSLGHGIGIEVHEYPYLSPGREEELIEGMVFSIEPGIYLGGEFGVRIEDLFTIEKGKLVRLTNCSNELIIL